MNNNILKYLVPVIALVVLVESVMIISNLRSKDVAPKVVEAPKVTETVTPAVESVYKITLSSDMEEMELDQKGKVEVKMMSNSDRSLDSVNVYVKYDPQMVEISSLTFDKKLPLPAFSKISIPRGLVVANFLVAEVGGLKVSANESLPVMSFDIKPLKAGALDFEISTGSELKESATMIVENGTSKVLPFSSNKLTVNVSL